MVQTMSFNELEALRTEKDLGVNAFIGPNVSKAVTSRQTGLFVDPRKFATLRNGIFDL